MSVTIIAAVMVMVAYFLVLYGGVGFIQDKKFFSSAPKEVLDAVPDHKERFPGAHVIGWIIAGIAVLLFAGAAVLSILDGIMGPYLFGYNKKTHIMHFIIYIPICACDRLDLYILLKNIRILERK